VVISAEQVVLDAIDPDAVVELASTLVAVPSDEGNETAVQEIVATELDRRGLEVEMWNIDMDALSRDPWFSAELERPSARGVLASLGVDDGPTLLLNGHVDVVPSGDARNWSTPAFTPTVRDGRLYGRGACDMKGGLAAAIHAAEAIRVAGIELAGRLLVAPVIGEEDGGSGTLALLRHGVTADACIIMEPTELSVVPTVAGALSWQIEVRGRSAHGCLREEGVSAVERFGAVHRAVLDLERRRNDTDVDDLFSWLDRPFAICGGRIAGGDWPSSEADWLTWEGRYGVRPGEDLDAARRDFEDAVASAGDEDPWLAEHPPTVTWVGGQFYPGATDLDAPIVTTVRGAATDVLGEPPQVRGMPYGCDLGLTVGVGGIPTVVFGPGDIRDAHAPDESVAIDELTAAARALALAAMRFCRPA
jgi:acetylornithine deacetylase